MNVLHLLILFSSLELISLSVGFCFVCLFLCTTGVPGVLGLQKEAGYLGPQLQSLWAVENLTLSPLRTVRAFKH